MISSKLLYFFFLFFVKFSSSFSFSSTHKCSKEQSDALLLFKQNISSTNRSHEDYHYISYQDNYMDSYCRDLLGSRYYPIILNWNTSIDCCHWIGVTCNNSTGDVISLILTCGMLKGTIHSNITLYQLSTPPRSRQHLQ